MLASFYFTTLTPDYKLKVIDTCSSFAHPIVESTLLTEEPALIKSINQSNQISISVLTSCLHLSVRI